MQAPGFEWPRCARRTAEGGCPYIRYGPYI